LPAVASKPVHVAVDGGRLTSHIGILLLSAVEERLMLAEQLAACPPISPISPGASPSCR
jgi:hypothetical protein